MPAAKPTADQLALMALCDAVGNPVPKVLFGTKGQASYFTGSTAAVKSAAKLLLENAWVEGTGEFEGKTAKSRKERYRLTAAGIELALSKGGEAALLQGMLGALDQNRERLEGFRQDVVAMTVRLEQSEQMLHSQRNIVEQLLEKLVPRDIARIVRQAFGNLTPAPDVAQTPAAWTGKALQLIREHRQKNPYGFCPLPYLYKTLNAATPLSIGTFHDGLRQLVEQRSIRLHPFTGSFSELVDEKYALLAAQEIKYYVECLV